MNLNVFSSPILKINYNRINSDYKNWKLWIWNETDKKPGFEIAPSGLNDYGLYFNLDISNLKEKKIGILPKLGNWEDKESFDRFFEYSGQSEIFIMEGDEKIYNEKVAVSTKIVGAYLDKKNELRVIFNKPVNLEFLEKEKFIVETGSEIYNSSKVKLNENKKYSKVAYLYFDNLNLDMEKLKKGNYLLKSNDLNSKVYLGDIVYDKDLFYSNEQLGVILEKNKTIFRVFSPTTISVNLILKRNGKEEKLPLSYKGKGIWEIKLDENLINSYYRYEAIYFDKILEGIDPYAACVSPDNKWGIIVKDDYEIYPSPIFDISQSIIYEASIRDLTSDEYSGVKNRGKYLSFTEENTRHKIFKDVKTAMEHLKELGINTIHLLPFYDFENDEEKNEYNWGYMPVNFNSPEGSYATKADGVYRVRELKEMISSFHKNGIKVVMDVVYNHTAETKEKIYNFNALSYDYFYRKRADGTYSNGSGCGNEFKTEAPMGRKYLIDSLKYWMKEYKIDGFRFDLMGLIDTDTAFEIARELRKIKPDILIYGEPWSAGDTPVKGISKGIQKGRNFSVFNDNLRDALKGSVFKIEDLGYAQSGNYREKVINGIKGSIDDFTYSPLESINYVSCHDNHTLWDRINISLPDEKSENKIKMDKLAQAVVFVSQGIPFILSGEEILRTKKGEDNSYNLGDEVNKIDWTRKKEFFDVYEYYRDLIKLKKEHSVFRMKSEKEIRENLKFYEDLKVEIKKPDIAFIIDGNNLKDNWGRVLVLINPEKNSAEFNLPSGRWILRFDQNGFKSDKTFYQDKIKVEPISLYVLSEK
jgi:pullulanase